MKKFGLVCVVGIVLILGGVVMFNYWGDRQGVVNTVVGPPEGYEEYTAKDGSRVEKLDIDNNVFRHYDKILELVAFAPGSGWLKFKTGSGISPTLSFNGVSQKDIQSFNRFSESLGLSIRAKLAGNVLHLTADIDKDAALVADNTEGDDETRYINQKGFYLQEEAPRLVISRDKDGKVFLVEAKDKPEETEAVVAKK